MSEDAIESELKETLQPYKASHARMDALEFRLTTGIPTQVNITAAGQDLTLHVDATHWLQVASGGLPACAAHPGRFAVMWRFMETLNFEGAVYIGNDIAAACIDSRRLSLAEMTARMQLRCTGGGARTSCGSGAPVSR